MAEWGVTVLEATAEVDGGDVWATRDVPACATTGKSSLYRHEVRRAAIEAVVEAVARSPPAARAPAPVDYGDPRVTGRPRPLIRQADRAIDWSADSTATVIRRIRAAEGHPGVLDTIAGSTFHLFGVHREHALRGAPGEIVAQRHGADLPRDRRRRRLDHPPQARRGHFKLPAARALALAGHGSTCPSSPRRCTRAVRRRAHVPRDRLRGARAASATCTSTSTTAR